MQGRLHPQRALKTNKSWLVRSVRLTDGPWLGMVTVKSQSVIGRTVSDGNKLPSPTGHGAPSQWAQRVLGHSSFVCFADSCTPPALPRLRVELHLCQPYALGGLGDALSTMPPPEALPVPEGFRRRALEVEDYHRGH